MREENLFSEEYDDFYSSLKGAVEECKHVFIEGNNLTNRFKELKQNATFFIGELGFGVGINFITTCSEWLKHTSDNQRLEFYSFDKYLFKPEHFKKIVSAHTELSEYILEYESNYPKNIEGIQRISLFKGRIILNLILGDISTTQTYLEQIDTIDAWFFDGFSPSKNPELWTKQLFSKINNSCHANSTFSTYSSSGYVKKNLKDAGFSYEKVKGFSHKRHMLKGLSSSRKEKTSLKGLKVAVIGSGIAGCTVSYFLSKQGIEVDLYEQEEDICSGASSHELLVTYPRLSAHDTPYGRFNLHAYVFATNFYESLQTSAWQQTGVLVLNHDSDSNKKQDSLIQSRNDNLIFEALDSKEASQVAGIEIITPAMLYRDAGYILPKQICKELIEHPKINLQLSTTIKEVIESGNKVSLIIDDKTEKYDFVCLCAGSDTEKIYKLEGFSKKRGQVTHIKSKHIFSEINLPICGKGYISPEINNIHVVGSSYSDIDTFEVLEEEHQHNLDNLKVINNEQAEIKTGKVGFRAVSKDHMPVVGNQGRVFVNTCHGSRASVTAPICADIVSSLISGKAPPLEKRELDSLSPNRFN